MAKSNNSFTGELLHFNLTMLRVVGEGNLRQRFASLDDINTEELEVIPMATGTNRQPTTLANFRDQRGQLVIYTQDISEHFNISKINVYVKQLASGYPQT